MRISDWSSDVCSSDLAVAFSGVEFAPDAGRQKVLRIAVEICEQLNDHLLALEPSLLELRRFDDPRMDKSLQLGQEIERLGTHRRLIVEKGVIIVAGLDHRVADHIAHEAADLAPRGGRIARSGERRGGKEGGSTGRTRGSPA